MAACAVDGKLVLFGGVGAAGSESILDVANDCWIFDPDILGWREVAPKTPWPSPRRCVGIAPSASGLQVWGGSGVTDGGTRYTFLNDWWNFDLRAESWSMLRDTDDHRETPRPDSTQPYPRYTPVFEATGKRLFLFGGYTEDRLGKRKLNDAWIHDGTSWSSVETRGREGYSAGAGWPGLRYGCMSVSIDDAVYVCGGFSDDGDHNDLWRFDMAARRWELITGDSASASAPSRRYCAAFAYDAGRLFMFGGRSRKNPKANYNDVWMFDLDSQAWHCVSANRTPHHYDAAAMFPGYHAKSASAVIDRRWYVWGGEGLHGHVSDFWRFSFDTLEWQLLQAARPDDPRFW
jgi:N-acetylneuraminic acid mutarotase